MCHILIFVVNKTKIFFTFFYLFLAFFSTLPSTQTIKVIDLIFFNELALKNWALEHAFQPYTYSLKPFFRGRGTPPQSIIDSDPQPF